MVHFDFRKLDVFSFGENQNCLVGSVDLLYRNSWNEVRTLHFNGEQSMIEALKIILGKCTTTPHRQIAWKSSVIASICAA
ncbi:class I adenylate cyclase [Escherichia coli]